MRASVRTAFALLGFTALALLWTIPLASHQSTSIPGGGFGDNVMFLWSFWWMRVARATGADFFRTQYLFAPAGTDLTLHTHIALTAFVGATLLRSSSIVTAMNVTTLASLALNGFCAYVLAHRLTKDSVASVIAGAIFACSPFVAAHLNGHFNLTPVWVLPLFALAIEPAMRGSWIAGAFAGLVLAATAYIDYYYVVYELAFAMLMLAWTSHDWSLHRRSSKLIHKRLLTIVGALIVLDVMLIASIAMSGGFALALGPLHLSVRDSFNPRQLLGVLACVAAWLAYRPRLTAQRREWTSRSALLAIGAMAAVFMIAAAPIVWHGIGVIQRGDYVSQPYFWRSGPVGVDVATLVLGNPFNGLWGSSVRHVYERIGINAIESIAWLGIVPIVLGAYAIRHAWNQAAVRFWTVVGLVFFVWSLGTHLYVFGWNTGVILPEAVLRYIPIASNARMPGRAMAMVFLALSLIAAAGLSHVRETHRGWGFAPVLTALILVLADFGTAPIPVTRVECPPIYQVLSNRKEQGAVAELPLGMGDGLGDVTPMDRGMLACQFVHERPLVGGVVARLSPRVMAAYRSDPLLAAWLRLSKSPSDAMPVSTGNDPLPDGQLSDDRLHADGIAFVVLNRTTASPELRDYVERILPLTLIGRDATRSIYVTRRSPAATADPD